MPGYTNQERRKETADGAERGMLCNWHRAARFPKPALAIKLISEHESAPCEQSAAVTTAAAVVPRPRFHGGSAALLAHWNILRAANGAMTILTNGYPLCHHEPSQRVSLWMQHARLGKLLPQPLLRECCPILARRKAASYKATAAFAHST